MYQASEKRYDTMHYVSSGNSGLKLPAISLGLWHNFGDTSNYETMKALCFTAFDNGITHFDLANNYGPEPGSAEKHFGRILNEELRGYRDELLISTKAGYDMWPGPYGSWGSRKYLLASLDQSLKRLGLEYVDISSITTGWIPTHRWRSPWEHWPMQFTVERRCMWDYLTMMGNIWNLPLKF